jgi:hypothetical protein
MPTETSDANLVFCYNKGCGKKFNPNDNPDGIGTKLHETKTNLKSNN